MQDDTRDYTCAEAQRLLEMWQRLSHTHMMAGGSCSCGVGGFAIALSDFEQDIADYVVTEIEKQSRDDVRTLMELHGREGDRWSISALLSSIADRRSAIDPHIANFVVERLAGTLQSFEKLHGGR